MKNELLTNLVNSHSEPILRLLSRGLRAGIQPEDTIVVVVLREFPKYEHFHTHVSKHGGAIDLEENGFCFGIGSNEMKLLCEQEFGDDAWTQIESSKRENVFLIVALCQDTMKIHSVEFSLELISMTKGGSA